MAESSKKSASASKASDLLGKVVRTYFMNFVEQSGASDKFKGESHPVKPLAALFTATDKNKYKDVGALPPALRQALEALFNNVINEVSDKDDDENVDLTSQDANQNLFLINAIQMDFSSIPLDERYKNINLTDLVAAIQGQNDFMRQKTKLSVKLANLFMNFLQTLAYRMFELSMIEEKPTSIDNKKFKAAFVTLTTSLTLQLSGQHLPTITALFKLITELEAKSSKATASIDPEIADDPEVKAAIEKAKKEKTEKSKTAIAAAKAAAEAQAAVSNKSLLESLSAKSQ